MMMMQTLDAETVIETTNEVAVATIVNFVGQYHDDYSGHENWDKKLDEWLVCEFEQLQSGTLMALVAALGREKAFNAAMKEVLR